MEITASFNDICKMLTNYDADVILIDRYKFKQVRALMMKAYAEYIHFVYQAVHNTDVHNTNDTRNILVEAGWYDDYLDEDGECTLATIFENIFMANIYEQLVCVIDQPEDKIRALLNNMTKYFSEIIKVLSI